MNDVRVVKLNAAGEEVWRYSGRIIRRWSNAMLMEARFDRQDLQVDDLWLRKGDRFEEVYFTDRWYNILAIHDRENDALKGWYCNISHPAVIQGDTISYSDLALDLIVYKDGRMVVLDADEFEALELAEDIKKHALAALEEVQALFTPPALLDWNILVSRLVKPGIDQ